MMNINLGMELEKDTNERVDVYDKFKSKKIILVDKYYLEKYNYKTAKISRTVMPEVFGLTDRYFGGNIYRCAIMKEEPYVVLVDRFFETLGILIPHDNLDKLNIKELTELCKRYKIEIPKDSKKDDIVELLKRS